VARIDRAFVLGTVASAAAFAVATSGCGSPSHTPASHPPSRVASAVARTFWFYDYCPASYVLRSDVQLRQQRNGVVVRVRVLDAFFCNDTTLGGPAPHTAPELLFFGGTIPGLDDRRTAGREAAPAGHDQTGARADRRNRVPRRHRSDRGMPGHPARARLTPTMRPTRASFRVAIRREGPGVYPTQNAL